MGTGKTLTALAIAGRLYLDGHIKRLLIVAPGSVCPVWPLEFKRYADFPAVVALMLGTAEQRITILRNLTADKHEGLRVAVINYESTWRREKELTRWAPDMIICDESQRIKSETAAQSKCMWRLGDRARFRLILTGTPIQNSPLDFWSQYRYLDPRIFGMRYSTFKAHHAVMGGMMVNGKPVQIIGYRNLDELTQKAYQIAYRVTKADALDLPEQTFERRPVLLSSREASLYKAMQKESLAFLGEHEATAPIILTRMLRLQQITGGFLKADDLDEVTQIGTSKLDALADIVDDYVIGEGQKLVVFSRFVPEVKAIRAMLTKRGVEHAAIWGAVPQSERGGLVARFESDSACKVFVAQLSTGGTGITLNAASLMVFYSLSFNFADYLQATARNHRMGQTKPCHYINLVAPGTIDEHVLDALDKKQDLAVRVVDGWKKFFKEGP